MLNLSLNTCAGARAVRSSLVAVVATALSACVTQLGVEGPTDGYYATGADLEVREAPPPLPDYDQPPCPEDGYLWTPGYWAWQSADLGGGDYYWVPGTWVQPPSVGVLWTPAYWGYEGGRYAFHRGYWGPHVGFYGGINYGYGYTGNGYAGGAWRGDRFAYNRAVTNVNVNIVHNTYNTTVINNFRGSRNSYKRWRGQWLKTVSPGARLRTGTTRPRDVLAAATYSAGRARSGAAIPRQRRPSGHRRHPSTGSVQWPRSRRRPRRRSTARRPPAAALLATSAGLAGSTPAPIPGSRSGAR